MSEVTVEHLGDQKYTVKVEQFTYEVTLSDEYYRELTGGKIPPENLIKISFEFLLTKEGPEAILKQFDLPEISRFFPEYEDVIRNQV